MLLEKVPGAAGAQAAATEVTTIEISQATVILNQFGVFLSWGVVMQILFYAILGLSAFFYKVVYLPWARGDNVKKEVARRDVGTWTSQQASASD